MSLFCSISNLFLEFNFPLDIFQGNSLMRILNVAAFAVSGYSSTEGRICKPFNPLLGETYEADYPDKGLRFFSEKVSFSLLTFQINYYYDLFFLFKVIICPFLYNMRLISECYASKANQNLNLEGLV